MKSKLIIILVLILFIFVSTFNSVAEISQETESTVSNENNTSDTASDDIINDESVYIDDSSTNSAPVSPDVSEDQSLPEDDADESEEFEESTSDGEDLSEAPEESLEPETSEDIGNESEDISSETSSDTSSETSSDTSDVFYEIIIISSVGGTISSNKDTAKPGEIVNLTILPANGFILESLIINGMKVDATSFYMPNSNANIECVFVIDPNYKPPVDESIESSDDISGTTSNDTSKDISSSESKNTSTEKKYNVSTSKNGKGTIETNKKSAARGTRILVTVIPDEGYKLEYIEFNGKKITEIGEKYAFTMPAKDVLINVVFSEIKEEESESSIPDTSNVSSEETSTQTSSNVESEPSESDTSVDLSVPEVNSSSSANESTDNSIIIEVSIDDGNNDDFPTILFSIPIIILVGIIASVAAFIIRKK